MNADDAPSSARVPAVPDPLAQLLADSRARIDRVDPEDAPAAMAAGAVLIDIRTEAQRRADGVVPGSIWYPRNCLEWRCAPGTAHLDPLVARANGFVLLMCRHGYQTSLAAAVLRDLGVSRAGDVIGGFEGWVGAGLPVEPYVPERDSLQGSDGATIRDY
jgi:rhodanese-related sulfurtransferase